MKTKLPLRFSILQLLIKESEGLTPEQLFHKLKDSYPNEKQCQPNTIDEHLMSMKGVGLIDVKSAIFDGNNQLISTYIITDYGIARLTKYVKLATINMPQNQKF